MKHNHLDSLMPLRTQGPEVATQQSGIRTRIHTHVQDDFGFNGFSTVTFSLNRGNLFWTMDDTFSQNLGFCGANYFPLSSHVAVLQSWIAGQTGQVLPVSVFARSPGAILKGKKKCTQYEQSIYFYGE